MAVLSRRPAATRGGRAGAALATAAVALLAGAPGASAQLILTQDEALEQAFGPEAVVERRTAYLDDARAAAIGERAGGEPLEGRVISWYEATRNGRPAGTAWFDAHRVRTLPQVLMVVVDPSGRVARVEVLKFAEPPEYRAPDGWLRQFDGRRLAAGLSLRGDVVGITGATLTSGAVTAAVRRVLALHEALVEGRAAP